MSIAYSAGEVLEIARQIERNGARFYTAAAESMAAAERQALLLDLASMERVHERTFASMSDGLSQQERAEPFYDPQGEATAYVRAVAGGQVFDLRADPVEWLGPEREMSQILRKAIGLEKDSIVFYLGIREAVPERLGREWVEEIIREEMGHVRLLDEQMRAVSD